MGKPEDAGFGKQTSVAGPKPKADPKGKPATKDSNDSPLAGSVAFRDWVIADREYKENSNRPQYS